MTDYTIYHNPRCSKSRQTLELLRRNGIEPTVIEYLKSPLTAAELHRIVSLLGIEAKDLLRRKEALFQELCPDGNLSNESAIELMEKHPKLMERPIVLSADAAAIGRPPENVMTLLE